MTYTNIRHARVDHLANTIGGMLSGTDATDALDALVSVLACGILKGPNSKEVLERVISRLRKTIEKRL